MVFHSGFANKQSDILFSPNWFMARAALYQKTAQWNDKPFDEVFFDFSAPNCGWIDVSVYVNGKKEHEFPLTEAFDGFAEIKTWLEDIVNDTKLSAELYLELEGRTAILHYEHIRLANVGIGRKFVHEDRDKDEWESFDANNGEPDTGLFYIYDSDEDDIPIACYCKTKQFIASLYNTLLYYASKGEHADLIGKEWYYMDYDNNGNAINDRWTFYNRIKSALIEWNHDSKYAYRHKRPAFKQVPYIRETVHMWAEWGDALFWHQRGGCSGNAERFHIDTENLTIDLSDIPEIRTWYDEFDNRYPEESWPEEDYHSWLKRGWELAKQIRKRMPQTVDLLYQWKSYRIEGAMLSIDIPFVVPDERLIIQRK